MNFARLFWIGEIFRFVLNHVLYIIMFDSHSCVPSHRIGNFDAFPHTSGGVVCLLMNTDHYEDLEDSTTLNDTLSSDIASSTIATDNLAAPNIHYCL